MTTHLEEASPTAADQQDLLDLADRYLPGACLGMMWLPPDLRMVMVRGQGSKVYDASGREYLDYMLGSGPLLLGHARPEVVEAVQRQAAAGSVRAKKVEPAAAWLRAASTPSGRPWPRSSGPLPSM